MKIKQGSKKTRACHTVKILSVACLLLAAQMAVAQGSADAGQTGVEEPQQPVVIDNRDDSRDQQPTDTEDASGDRDQGMASDTTAQPTGPAGQAHQDQENPAGPRAEAIAQEAFPNVPLGDLQDRTLTNLEGVEVGQVENVVVNPKSGEAALVVSVGGILGIGDKEVLLGAEEVEASEQEVIWQSTENEDALKQMPAYNRRDFVSVR